MSSDLALSNRAPSASSRCGSRSSLLCSRTVLDDAIEGSEGPGVGSYNIGSGSKLQQGSAPAFTIKGKYPTKKLSSTAGPSDYNTRASIASLEHIPGGTMTNSNRFRRSTSTTPGPGSYDQSRSIIHSQGSTMSFRYKKLDQNTNPGPNQYNTELKKAPRGYSMSGRHDSFQNMFKGTVGGGPGPGQYTPTVKNSSSNNSTFPRSGLGVKSPHSENVGPGKYDIMKGFDFNKRKSGGTGFTFGSRNKGHTF